MNIIFFGSASDSVIVADILHKTYPIAAVVTQPAKPVGRKQLVAKTAVAAWAKHHGLPCLSFQQDHERKWQFDKNDTVTDTLAALKPDLLVTACFGQKLPSEALAKTPFGGLNIHPSLLPRWRGADPVPWTIIAGDAQTGVTVSTITDAFDSGNIVVQKKIPVPRDALPDILRTELFTLGAHLLVETLTPYIQGNIQPYPQKQEDVTTARKLDRKDGYVPWELVAEALQGQDVPREKRSGLVKEITEPLQQAIVRLHRALSPWPGVWTTIAIEGIDRRVKLLDLAVRNNALTIQKVQLEGKNPVDWNTFRHAYLA